MHFFFEQIFVFKERFQELGEYEYGEDEKEAGIELFSEGFGVFITIDKLAGGDVLKYDQILEMEAEVIYMKLLMDKQEGEYRKNLADIHKRQQDFEALNNKLKE